MMPNPQNRAENGGACGLLWLSEKDFIHDLISGVKYVILYNGMAIVPVNIQIFDKVSRCPSGLD